MGGFSLMHWGIVAIVVLLLFGKRRASTLMGEVGQALGDFRKELADDDGPPPAAVGEEPGGASGRHPPFLV